MADEETTSSRDDDESEPHGRQFPQTGTSEPSAEFRMELVDSLPGGRAVMGVERKGEFTWLADRHHVSSQARDEFVDQLSRIVREQWWVQNWPGAS